MNKTIIVGNWKMNKTRKEALEFLSEVYRLLETENDKVPAGTLAGLGVPATVLQSMSEVKKNNKTLLAAQNMHFEKNGAFTGELSVEMIKDVGANAVILGHSERRAMFNETDADVNAKTKVALANDLTPIVCVGETLEEREAGKDRDVVKSQITASLKGVTEWDKVIIAYEPVWAIGTGKTATAKDAQDMCAFIRSLTNKDVVIQYGGSVKPENVAEIMSQPDINGALVGGASLDPKSFVKLLTLNK